MLRALAVEGPSLLPRVDGADEERSRALDGLQAAVDAAVADVVGGDEAAALRAAAEWRRIEPEGRVILEAAAGALTGRGIDPIRQAHATQSVAKSDDQAAAEG